MEIYYTNVHKNVNGYVYSEDFEYSGFQEKYSEQINIIINKFEKFIDSNVKESYELKYTVNPGPFGLAWGMNKSEVHCIGEVQYDSKGNGFDINEFKKYYYYENDYFDTCIIKPEKSNDKIKNYTGIFDENGNIFQIVCVNYSAYATEVNELGVQTKEAKSSFDNIKETLSQIYGEGKNMQNRGVQCIRWNNSSGQLIELLQSRYMRRWGDSDGIETYIWLIYSSPDYNSTVERIQNEINTKDLEKQLKEQDKAKSQDAYL